MSEKAAPPEHPMACPLCGSPIHRSETKWIAAGRWASLRVTFSCESEWDVQYNFIDAPSLHERLICVTRQRDQLQAQLGMKKEADKSSGGAGVGERGYDH